MALINIIKVDALVACLIDLLVESVTLLGRVVHYQLELGSGEPFEDVVLAELLKLRHVNFALVLVEYF